MQEPQNPLLLELLRWIALRPRTYAETMDVWRTSCPRHSVWEDAQLAGFVETEGFSGKVALTPRGRAMLDASQNRATAR